MDNQTKLSDVLRSKRYENKHTQEKAAELFDISVRNYRKLESGESLPSFRTICKMAKEYSINFAQFAEDNEKTI